MTRFNCLCRIALTLAVLAALTPAALAGPFRASGSYQFTGSQGNTAEGVSSGRAAPGGPFEGAFAQRGRAGGLEGTSRLVFNNGTLDSSYVLEFDDAIGMFVGTYVITGGTGAYAGATGRGNFLVEPADATGAGDFWLDGTLDR